LNYYELLRISRVASDREIKLLYKALAKNFHPDINKDENAEEEFKKIQEAYEILSNPAKRKEYDIILDNNSELKTDVPVSKKNIIKKKPQKKNHCSQCGKKLGLFSIRIKNEDNTMSCEKCANEQKIQDLKNWKIK
jgi:curved DNA-binding protein CbpA